MFTIDDVKTLFTSPTVSAIIGLLSIYRILDIKSTGLMDKWWREWHSEAGGGCGPLQNEPIGAKVVLGPFFLLALAAGLSVIILALERLKSKQSP